MTLNKQIVLYDKLTNYLLAIKWIYKSHNVMVQKNNKHIPSWDLASPTEQGHTINSIK